MRTLNNYLARINNPYRTHGEYIAFQEGIKAFVEFVSIDKNPYERESSWGVAWRDGYSKAIELSFDKNDRSVRTLKTLIEISLVEEEIMKNLQSLKGSFYPSVYDIMFKYFWTGVLVKHHLAALDIISAEQINTEEIGNPIAVIEIIYIPKNKSDFVG